MPIGSNQPFRPAGTAVVSASTTSSAVLLVGAGETVVVTNASAAVAFVSLGASASLTATGSGFPVLPNSRVLLAANPHLSHAAAVLSGGSGQVYFTLGDGSTL